MKKTIRAILSLIALFVFGQGHAQQRYLDEVFTDVTVTSNVVYGQNFGVLTGTPLLQPLVMDVYEPTGDTATKRPVIIYLHTGSFLPILINGTPTGDMHDSATVEMCKQFARRGYVAISMDYRVGWNPVATGPTGQDVRTGTLLIAVYRSLQDVKTCVRYVKMDASIQGNTFKIDTSRIVLGGQGSGGYVVLAYATLDKVAEIQLLKFISSTTDLTYGFIAGQPYVNQAVYGDFAGLGGLPTLNMDNWPGYSNKIEMVFNMGGALGDSSWLEPGDVPMVCFHVPNDPFAPYGNGNVIVPTTGQFVVFVSGSREVVRMCNDPARGWNNNVFNISYNDPYTTRANQVNEGFEGLFPFVLPDPSIIIPGDPFHGQAGPWEWFNQAALEAIAPLYGKTAQQADSAYMGGLLTNPDMSKTKGLSYIDSIQGYLAPRVVQQLQLPGYHVGIDQVDLLASGVDMFPNPAVASFTLQLDDPKERMEFIRLYDMTGRLVKQIDHINDYIVQISRDDFSTGVYVIEIGLKGKVIRGKLMFD